MTTHYIDTHIKRLALAREAAQLGARHKSVAALSCGLYAILITAKRHPLLQAVQIAFWHKVRDLSSAPSRY